MERFLGVARLQISSYYSMTVLLDPLNRLARWWIVPWTLSNLCSSVVTLICRAGSIFGSYGLDSIPSELATPAAANGSSVVRSRIAPAQHSPEQLGPAALAAGRIPDCLRLPGLVAENLLPGPILRAAGGSGSTCGRPGAALGRPARRARAPTLPR